MLEAKQRYTPLEHLTLALLVAAKKLWLYFQVHAINVLTSYPIRDMLAKLDLFGWMLQSSIELSEYEISNKPWIALKENVLTNFVAEFTEDVEVPEPVKVNGKSTRPQIEMWHLYVDGASSQKGAGLGIHLKAPFGNIDKSMALGFEDSNNEVEYEALLHGLETAQLLGTRKTQAYFDSKLVVCQVLIEYEAKDDRMRDIDV